MSQNFRHGLGIVEATGFTIISQLF